MGVLRNTKWGRFNYGDGRDGDFTPGAGYTFLTLGWYNRLTITAGLTAYPDGWPLVARRSIIINGTLSRKGNPGAGGAAGGAGGAGFAGRARAIPAGSNAGGAGGLLAGTAAAAYNYTALPLGRNGGAGGAGSGGAGGAGGVNGVYANMFPIGPNPGITGFSWIDGIRYTDGGPQSWHAGQCGGGGGGDPVRFGGGGGSCGFPIVLCAPLIVVSATGLVDVRGGAGGAGDPAGNCGGGGGGCGSWIVCICDRLVEATALSLRVNGALGGAKSGTGVVGGLGSDGWVFRNMNKGWF